MPSVVIIHAAEDALPARALAEKLRAAKLEVVIEVPPGEPLRQAVKSGQATLALWSPRSVSQPAVIEEVAFAKRNGGVFHARMQNTATPEDFKNDKSIDLTGWRGEDEFAAWRDLAKLITAKAGVPNLPPPEPRPPSGFFQPGMVNAQAPQAGGDKTRRPPPPRPQAQPQPRAPGQAQAQRPAAQAQRPSRPQPRAAEPKKSGGMGMIAIITFIVVAIAGGGGYFVWNNMQSAKASASAWETVDHSDAAALRAFIASAPGQFRDEASTALAHLEEQSFDAAKDADSIEAFQSFLSDFPDSAHALEARGRIAELQAMPTTTTMTDTALPAESANPDLLPPTATTAPAPESGGGPVPLTPAPTTP